MTDSDSFFLGHSVDRSLGPHKDWWPTEQRSGIVGQADVCGSDAGGAAAGAGSGDRSLVREETEISIDRHSDLGKLLCWNCTSSEAKLTEKRI